MIDRCVLTTSARLFHVMMSCHWDVYLVIGPLWEELVDFFSYTRKSLWTIRRGPTDLSRSPWRSCDVTLMTCIWCAYFIPSGHHPPRVRISSSRLRFPEAIFVALWEFHLKSVIITDPVCSDFLKVILIFFLCFVMLWSSSSTVSSTMTSLNENILRVTGHLSGENNGHRWIPLKKASDAELWCFLWSAPEQRVEQTIETSVI